MLTNKRNIALAPTANTLLRQFLATPHGFHGFLSELADRDVVRHYEVAAAAWRSATCPLEDRDALGDALHSTVITHAEWLAYTIAEEMHAAEVARIEDEAEALAGRTGPLMSWTVNHGEESHV